VDVIRQNEQCVAIASTAFKMENNLKTGKQLNKHLWKSDLIIQNAKELAGHYVDSRSGIAAFPSYTYKTEALKDLCFDQSEAGKYSDVTFLLKLANRGPILWLQQPLLYYRIHDKNDSKLIEINNLRMLVRFLRKKVGLTARELQEFRVKSYYIWSQSSAQGVRGALGKRRKLIRKITFSYYLKNPMGLFLFFFDKLI